MIKILLLLFELNYAFTFGYVVFDDILIYEIPEENKIYFTEYEIEILFLQRLFLKNSLQVNMYEETFLRVYYPYQIRFDIIAGIFFDFFEFGFHHYCIHPIVTFRKNRDSHPKIFYEGGREEIYIKFSNKK
jgi:hypothetical protein